MCVIIYKPKGVNLPTKEILTDCFMDNPHGIGYCVRTNDNKLIMDKGLWDIEDFFDVVKPVRKYLRNIEMAIHFRYASVGNIKDDNCHPFITKNGSVLFHNGTIRWLKENNFAGMGYEIKKDSKTDTEQFIKYLEVIEDRLDNEKARTLLQQATNSKFLIMTKENTYLIGDYEKKEGCYFSNLYWQPVIVKNIANNEYVNPINKLMPSYNYEGYYNNIY